MGIHSLAINSAGEDVLESNWMRREDPPIREMSYRAYAQLDDCMGEAYDNVMVVFYDAAQGGEMHLLQMSPDEALHLSAAIQKAAARCLEKKYEKRDVVQRLQHMGAIIRDE